MIRIVQRGQFKVAECSGGFGDASTVTFIQQHAAPLAADIQRARCVWIRTERATGKPPDPQAIAAEFSEIAKLCTDQDVLTYVAHSSRLTPRMAALEILQGLFPTCSPQYIERSTRARRSTRIISRFQVGKPGKARQSTDTSAPQGF